MSITGLDYRCDGAACVRKRGGGRASRPIAPVRFARRFIFGFRGDLPDCVYFRDDHMVIYAAGHSVVMLDRRNMSQRFFHGSPNTDGITAVCVSPCHR